MGSLGTSIGRRVLILLGAAAAAIGFAPPGLSPEASLPAAAATGFTAGASGGGLVAGVQLDAASEATVFQQLGRTPKLVGMFTDFQTASGWSPFPTKWAQGVISLGSTPMVTWQPKLSSYKTQSVLTTIASGALDPYISSWASAARALGHPVYVRVMHEFNGAWYPWGAVTAGKTRYPDGTGVYSYSNTPAMYVAAYRRIVDDFRAVGATNVEFVWCVSTGAPLTGLSSYYPGDAYVSWPAMDGYNRSSTAPRPFPEIFTPAYDAIQSFTAKPMMVAETASVEFSGLPADPSSKAQWISDAYLTQIPGYFPRIQIVNWFDLAGTNGSYLIDSSPQTLQAIRSALASPLYQGSPS